MIKRTKGWALPSKLDHKHSIYVRSFSGAKVRSMKDYESHGYDTRIQTINTPEQK